MREMGRLKRSPALPTLRSPANSGNLSTDAGRLPSPGLTNLNSNNPFRNRAASPANSPIVSTFGNIPNTAPDRPLSRNPFLDQTEKKDTSAVRVRSASPDHSLSAMDGGRSPTKPALTGHAIELFVGLVYDKCTSAVTDSHAQDNLTLNDGPSTITNGTPQGQPPPYVRRPIRSENRPPRPMNGAPGHFPSRSNEDPNGRPRTGKPQRDELDIFADPVSPENGQRRPRPRRNSDSSINNRILSPEDERKRRERHRREREARHRGDGKSRPPTSSRSKKPNKQLDIIDSLDVTSIFGTGSKLFDGMLYA